MSDDTVCDPNIENCDLPEPKDFVVAHFFLWFLTFINGSFPILYKYLFFDPELDDNPNDKVILERNWWWFDTAIPMVVWGHIGIYGFPAFFGLFTWFGVKFFDKIYEFWMTAMMSYVGTLMHFMASLAFLAGVFFWVDNGIVSKVRGWITAGVYVGWTVFTFFWIGLTLEKSKQYMFLKHCDEDCHVEVPAEEDDAVEIDEDATVFAHNIWGGF